MLHQNKISKLLIFMGLFMGSFSMSFAQKLLKEIPNFSFIDTASNKISYVNDIAALHSFFIKMDSAVKYNNQKVSILHMGGSHIQADIYSNRLRTNLLAFHPNLEGERGFLFPFSAASTNNPKNYQTSYSGIWETTKNIQKDITRCLGIGGIVITTTDSLAEITIKLRNLENPKTYFNRVRIIGINKNYLPLVYTDSLQYFTGNFDSISSSYLFDLKNLKDTFTLKLKSLDSIERSFSIEGIILENDQLGLSYHSIGVNGASVPSFLKSDFLERDLKLLKPDLVILSIGINDAVGEDFDVLKFKSNYDTLIQRIKSAVPNVSILFTTNNDSFRKKGRKYYVNTNGLLVRTAFFELAEKHHAAVWDLFSIMGGLSSMKHWETAGLTAKDKVHFKTEGYNIIGDLLFNALIKEYISHYY